MVRLVIPDAATLEAVDESWPLARRPTDWHLSWRWKELMRRSKDGFAIVDKQTTPRGFWCSKNEGTISLPEGAAYRVDNLEIDPQLRGRNRFLSTMLMALAATRALELGAAMVVLAALPIDGLIRFYRGLGGAQRAAQGWNVDKRLVPFVLEKQVLNQLKEAADGFLQSEEA